MTKRLGLTVEGYREMMQVVWAVREEVLAAIDEVTEAARASRSMLLAREEHVSQHQAESREPRTPAF